MPVSIYITSIITVVIIVLLITKSKIVSNPKVRRFLIFILVFAVPSSVGSTYSHLSNAHSLKVGDYKLVEGKIENFSPAASNPKGHESFQVNGEMFSYSSTFITGGLTHSIADSGLVKNGSDVKVYYKYNAILRLEVKK